jgi:hypothetical protein
LDVDQSIIAEANRDCGLTEAVDALGAERYETVQVVVGRADLHLEPKRTISGHTRIAAPPTVPNRHI